MCVYVSSEFTDRMWQHVKHAQLCVYYKMCLYVQLFYVYYIQYIVAKILQEVNSQRIVGRHLWCNARTTVLPVQAMSACLHHLCQSAQPAQGCPGTFEVSQTLCLLAEVPSGSKMIQVEPGNSQDSEKVIVLACCLTVSDCVWLCLTVSDSNMQHFLPNKEPAMPAQKIVSLCSRREYDMQHL